MGQAQVVNWLRTSERSHLHLMRYVRATCCLHTLFESCCSQASTNFSAAHVTAVKGSTVGLLTDETA